MPREYFHAYHDYLDYMAPLGDAERGRLFTALLKYSATGEAPELNGNERFIFPMMAAQIRREAAAYDDKCAKLKANGSKSKQKPPIGSKSKQKPPIGSICGEEKEEEKEEDEDEEEDEEEGNRARTRETPATPERVPYEKIIALYNTICVSLPKAGRYNLNPIPDSDNMQKCYEQSGCSLDEMSRVFKRVEASNFLCGRKARRNGQAPFMATLPWLMQPDNFRKVREGRYDNNAAPKQSGGLIAQPYDFAEIEAMLDREWKDSFDEEGEYHG